MSKEFIVSSTRHETRVAILEDDQVVEIYYQREKEYTLAGSIHKGRVTRVLPGMQSAFVDIGLERDAFLYVSDFFEDNEEYDKIVSGVEEKVLKMEKGERVAPPASLPEGEAGLAAPPLTAAAVNPGSLPGEGRESRGGNREPSVREPGNREGGGRESGNREAGGREPGSREASGREPGNREAGGRDSGGDRGGRGRRGRRRRGQSGLPESKFYSPRNDRSLDAGAAAPESGDAESTPAVRTLPVYTEPVRTGPVNLEDFAVLPGESLAKYSAGGVAQEEETVEETYSEASEPLLESQQAEPGAAELEEDVDVREEVRAVHEEAAAEVIEELDTEETAEADAPAVTDEAELAEDLEPDEVEVTDEQEVEFTEAIENAVEDAEAEAGETAEYVVNYEASGEELEHAARDENEVEPARIPQSLTATLREQNPRYGHRVSRRVRRRGRGGERGERAPQDRNPQGAVPPTVDGAPAALPGETRTANANVRSDGRPEREPRNDREPRGERPEREARGERPEREGGRGGDRGQARTVRPALPQITDLLRSGQEIIVQIAKEPLGQKGARITSHIALPGRFLVYMPTVDHVGVSRKIPSDDERLRLKKILQANRQGIPGGYIVRTAGDGRTEEELRADMMFLYNMWMDMRQRAEKKPAPALLHHDLDVVQRILRDQLTSQFKTVWVDNEEVYESVLGFVQRFQPAMVSRVKLYTRPTPIFDEFGITAELEKALRPKVWLKSGGYIVINQTEALVAIDINTGKYVGKSNRLEDTIVKINSDAIKEIVRQIRLRDLGGIIVVDFIDMDERKNRQKVMQALEEAMRADRAPYKILQFNDFGLVAITRKRVKQSLERTLCSPCPYCEGAGSIKSVPTVIGEILVEAQKMAKVIEGDNAMLRVNPEVAKVLKSNSNDQLQELEEILGRTVIIKSDPLLHQTKFDLA